MSNNNNTQLLLLLKNQAIANNRFHFSRKFQFNTTGTLINHFPTIFVKSIKMKDNLIVEGKTTFEDVIIEGDIHFKRPFMKMSIYDP